MATSRIPIQVVTYLLLALSTVIQGSPVTAYMKDEAHIFSRNDHDSDLNWGCPFPGNSDLYGLGIRIGIYLQLFSTLLTNATLSDELREDAHNTNAIIMVAVFAGMINATIKSQLNSVEIYIMSTLLTAFLWSDFTPRHISSYVLAQGKQRRRLTRRERISWAIPKDFEKDDRHEADEQIEVKKSYFAAISRSIFGTAIAVFNLWFWLYGRQRFLRHDIENQQCKPLVFLHQQIELGTNQVMLYIIVTVAYAVFEVFFMLWWLVVLTPSTIRLFYDITIIIAVAICSGRLGNLWKIRNRAADWYLGFAKLDASKLKMFERFTMRRSTTDKLSRIRLMICWFGLPIGYTIVIWSSLAVELSLAWNGVTGMYALGSTGQLIPFVVGLLGLLRNLHLIAVQFSERVSTKHDQPKEIKVDFGSGAYVYGLGKDKELKLEAAKPERRWSIDSGFQPLQVAGRDCLAMTQSPQSLRSFT